MNIVQTNPPPAGGPLKLADILAGGHATPKRRYLAVLGNNLGFDNLNLTIRLTDLHSQTFVYNPSTADADEEVAQRNLDPGHARGLGLYALAAAIKKVLETYAEEGRVLSEDMKAVRAMIGPQTARGTYSLVANVRSGVTLNGLEFTPLDLQGAAVAGSPYTITVPDEIWALLEGQHRREGWHLADRWLTHVDQYGRYPTAKDGIPTFFGMKGGIPTAMIEFWRDVRRAYSQFTVTVQLYLGLTIEQERQLFSDFNSKGRLVKSDITYQYDRGNPIVNYMHDQLVAMDLVRGDDDEPTGGRLTLTEAAGICSIAFINRTNPKGALPNLVEERASVVSDMFRAIEGVSGFGSPDESVINQVVVQKAVAKLVYDLSWARSKSDEEREANQNALNTLLSDLEDVNFAHDNWLWRYYLLEPAQQDALRPKGRGGDILKYLPKDEAGDVAYKDLGTWDASAKKFTFSVKHNDTYPIIADLIRFRLGLSPRHDA